MTVLYQSAVSGLWYENRNAAGTIKAIQVDLINYPLADPEILDALNKFRIAYNNWREEPTARNRHARDEAHEDLEMLLP